MESFRTSHKSSRLATQSETFPDKEETSRQSGKFLDKLETVHTIRIFFSIGQNTPRLAEILQKKNSR